MIPPQGVLASDSLPPASEIRYSDRHQDLDFTGIHAWLASTYWSPGITREQVERGFANSRLVMGAYIGSRQVGVARALTDTTRFGYVLDVFVAQEWRGHGIARTMVRRLVEQVYRPLGFAALAHPDRWMERLGPTG